MGPHDLLAVFRGIHQTLEAESRMKAAGVPAQLIPTPRAIRSDCGYSLVFAADAAGAGRKAWESLGMHSILFRMHQEGEQKSYEEIDRREGASVPAAGHPLQEGPCGGGDR